MDRDLLVYAGGVVFLATIGLIVHWRLTTRDLKQRREATAKEPAPEIQ